MKKFIKFFFCFILLFLVESVYAAPANDLFLDDNLYKCIIDAYNVNLTDKKDYSYNILPEEERINFENDATTIYNQIRALLDEPCAYFNFKGFESDTDRIKVVEAKIGSITTDKEPGSIVGKSKKYFTIACGNGTTLDIYKLQPFGKNKMSATDFINGGLRKYWKEN